mmetsp:Transcript_23841/g.32783  ORF Transcript_23841/g.32783 Transcript_23841/m.32783 type:complete len:99 (+) Transcript_23841:309-605(+)
MVCQKCEKKLSTLACPDKWKTGSSSGPPPRDTKGSNKSLGKKKASARYNPYAIGCKVCKCPIHTGQGMYCHACAYKKGVCAICGVQVLDTSFYKQSSV